MRAVLGHHTEIVQKLIQAGANVNAKTDVNLEAGGRTPLMFGAEYGRTDIVVHLLREGAYC